MFGFIVELLEGILSFLADVFLLRKHRDINGRPRNRWKKDATDVAHLEWWIAPVLTALGVAAFFFMFSFLGLSFTLSFFIAVVPVALYGAYRLLCLMNA